jgi:hypothetical protein
MRTDEDYDQYYGVLALCEQYYDVPLPYEQNQSYARAVQRYIYDQVPQYTDPDPMMPKANSGRPHRANSLGKWFYDWAVDNGLMMCKTKCIHVDNSGQPFSNQNAEGGGTHTQSVFEDHWQALIVLHRTLLHEQHNFLLATQHPSASPALTRLAAKYSRLAISPIDAFYTKVHGMKNQIERSPRKPPSLIRRLDGLM